MGQCQELLRTYLHHEQEAIKDFTLEIGELNVCREQITKLLNPGATEEDIFCDCANAIRLIEDSKGYYSRVQGFGNKFCPRASFHLGDEAV